LLAFANEGNAQLERQKRSWTHYFYDEIDGWEIAGYHNTVLRDPHAQILGSRLEIWMRTLEECDT